MSSGVYGGDEVGAVVFDAGHYTFRAGYAGEENPKADIPSTIGVLEHVVDAVRDDAMDMDENARPPTSFGGDKKKNKVRYNIDTASTYAPIPGMEMSTFLDRDGLIEDWDMFEGILDYTYKRYILSESNSHPLLMSEPPINNNLSKSKREKLGELLFEKYDIPALFLAKSPVLAAFASGRSTGLIVDSGARQTTATPVYDGYAYTQAVVRSEVAGDMLTNQCKYFMEQKGVEVVPPYLIASKEAVEETKAANWTKKTVPEVTKSYHNYMTNTVLRDMQSSVLQLSDTPYDHAAAEKMPAFHYEFPNGYNLDFVSERLSIAEGLFDTQYLKGVPTTSTLLSVTQVATTSIGMCDIDMRSALYGSVIITGGNSLVQGFTERVQLELNNKCPSNCRLRLIAPPTSAERRFATWIGGSILGSLGSFQQMWVSKQEWEESGKSVLDKKCP